MTYIEPVRVRKEQLPAQTQPVEVPSAGRPGGGRPIPTDIVSLSANAGKPDPRGSEKTEDRLEAALDGRPPRPSDIGLCLSMGRVDAAVQAAARLSGVPTAAAVNAYRNGDVGKALSQLASIGVDSGTAGWLLRGMGRSVPATPADASRAQVATAAYMSTSRQAQLPEANDDRESEETYEPVDLRI